MTPRCKSPAHEPPAIGVATIDTSLLDGTDFTPCLSRHELQRYHAFSSARRQREWLGARLAAKFIFVRRLVSRDAVMRLSREDIVSIPFRLYETIEVIADDDGRPGLQWRGRKAAAAVSLSHTGRDACACIAATGEVGLDVQNVADRIPAFYRTNYTAAETQWVNRGVALEPASRDWLYTLLWALKEAALKARMLLARSPVSFGGIGLSELPAPQTVLQARRDDGPRLLRASARIGEAHVTRRLHMAFAGTRTSILTVVQPWPSGPALHANSVEAL